MSSPRIIRQSIKKRGGWTPRELTRNGTVKVGWFDFTDPTSMTFNADGTGGNPKNGDWMGRIYNKADPAYNSGPAPTGSYLSNSGQFLKYVTDNVGVGSAQAERNLNPASDTVFRLDEPSESAYVRTMTNSNNTGWTFAHVGSATGGYSFMWTIYHSGNDVSIENYWWGDVYRFPYGINGSSEVSASIAMNLNVRELFIGTADRTKPEKKLWKNGTFIGSVTDGNTNADPSGTGNLFRIFGTTNTDHIHRMHQFIIVPRVLDDGELANLTEFCKTKCVIS